MKKILMTMATCFLTACSIIPVPTDSVTRFALEAPQLKAKAHSKLNLLIDTPVLNSALQTNRIVIKPRPLTIDYLADVEWMEKLDTMILETTAYAFQDSGVFQNVYMQTSDAPIDRWLKLDVRSFGFEERQGQKYLVVSYFARLYKMPERESMGHKLFSYEKPYIWQDVPTFIHDLNAIHQQFVGEMLRWVNRV